MKVYEFHNTLNNIQSKWPRYFVAFSLSEAKQMAKEWEETVNQATDSPEMKFSFDYDNVKTINTNNEFDNRGYVNAEKIEFR